MLEEERRIDPNKLIELEKKLRDEVARHTPYHERKQTILVRAFQTFDHEKKGTLPLDAFRRALQCFNVEVSPSEGRALFRKFGQDGQRRLPWARRRQARRPRREPERLSPDAMRAASPVEAEPEGGQQEE